MILRLRRPMKVQPEPSGHCVSLNLLSGTRKHQLWIIIDEELQHYLRLTPGSVITELNLRHLKCEIENNPLEAHPWLWLKRRARRRKHEGSMVGSFLLNLSSLNPLLKNPFSIEE